MKLVARREPVLDGRFGSKRTLLGFSTTSSIILGLLMQSVEKAAGICPAASALNEIAGGTPLEIDADSDVTAL